MADEVGPNEMRNLWCNQPVDPVRMSADDLRRKAQELEMHSRRGVRRVAVLMFLVALGYASFLYFFPGTVHRIGASLTLVGYLYCAYQLRRKAPPVPASATCATYRAQLARQRDLCRAYWRTLMLPVVPGPAVFMMGFLVPEQGFVKAAVLTTMVILSPFVMAIPLLHRRARTLQSEIDALDALMRPS